MDLMFKTIYKIGEKLHNPRLAFHEKKLLETDFETIENLEKLQLEKLKKLFLHARNSSIYFKDVLKNIDINTMTLDILNELPILTKQDVQKYKGKIQNKVDNKKHFKSVTSGSTGSPFVFSRNRDWDASHRAAIMRGYSWYGIKPWHKSLYFWGFNPNRKKRLFIKISDFLMNRRRVFSYNDEDFKGIEKYMAKVKYVEGYSSAIFTMAQYFTKIEKEFNKIKMVKGTSEKIFDYYQKKVHQAFNQKMISEYGSSEGGIIAYECPQGHMHIVMENVIVEEVDKKILVTNLHSLSFPMIRYELGDYIELDKETKCDCGREHYIIKEVTGRIGKKIEGFENKYLSSSLFYMFKNLALEEKISCSYFACQDKIGILNLKILCEQKYQIIIEEHVRKEKKILYKNDIDLKISFISELEHNNRKTQSFESNLDSRSRKCK